MQDHESASLAGRRVLIVEDERLVALYNRDLLEGWGCEVLGPVGSVTAALALLGSETPEAALLDADLNGETTEPVAKVLNAILCPFLVTTAFAPLHLDLTLADAPFLSKPVNEARLKQVLKDLLSA